MFVEKLKSEDYMKFIYDNLFNCSEYSTAKILNYSVVIGNGNNLPKATIDVQYYWQNHSFFNATLEFKDFNFKVKNASDSRYEETELYSKKWRKFLYSKFGEEYKTACNEHLKKDYEDNLIK